MTTFTHFGSCVSRDIFNFMNLYEFSPVSTINGINISTFLTESDLKICDEDIVADDNFWFRMQKLIFQHPDFRTYMERGKTSDYFIFDLGSERLPLQKWEYGTQIMEVPVTWNTYRTSLNVLKNSEYLNKGIRISDWHLADRNRQKYETDIEEFCRVIQEHYTPDHIIYISIRQAKEFINKDTGRICNFNDYEGKGIERESLRNRQDLVISHAEEVVLKNIPDMWKIKMPENALADERHHFGRHTLHFYYRVYEYFAECVQLIAGSAGMDPKDISKIRYAMKLRKKYAEIKLEDLRRLYFSQL